MRVFLTSRGSVTLLLLALLMMLTVMMTSSLQLIAQQTHQTVDQEHELQSLDIADAGIQYATWLVSPTGGNQSLQTLQTNPPSVATDHQITDTNGQSRGSFTLTFPNVCSDRIQVLAVGRDQAQPQLCQGVEAILQEDSTGEYRITSWSQLSGHPCTSASVSSPLVCPVIPTPTLTPLPT